MGYKANREKLKSKECIFLVAKQGLMKNKLLKTKKKRENENRCGRPNMALHLNEDKDQHVVFGSSFLSNPVF